MSTGGSGTTSSGTTTSTSASATSSASGTMTTSATPTSAPASIVIENIVVNVKGKDNIVVLTQTIEGSADVDISAARASGQGSIDQSDDGMTSSATTNTASTSTYT